MTTDNSVRSKSPSQDRTAEAEESLARELGLISDRLERAMFPIVLPSEQNALETEFATQLLAAAEQMDAAEIQSYIDQQWNIFQQSNTLSEEKSEAVLRAEWARSHYYEHLRKFIAEQEQDSTVFESLQRFLSTGVLTCDAESRIRCFCASINSAQTSELVEYINASWQREWLSFPHFLRSDCASKEATMQKAWFL